MVLAGGAGGRGDHKTVIKVILFAQQVNVAIGGWWLCPVIESFFSQDPFRAIKRGSSTVRIRSGSGTVKPLSP